MSEINVISRPRAIFLKSRERTKRQLSRLQTAFRESSYQGLHATHCEWEHGVLVLQGKVMSFFLKQMAQELVFHTLGRLEMRNEIEVEPPEHVLLLD